MGRPWHPVSVYLEGVMPASSLDGLLIGRDDELARLMACVSEVREGRGQAVLVEGEPGIGKSALVRAACAEAIGLGCVMNWGRRFRCCRSWDRVRRPFLIRNGQQSSPCYAVNSLPAGARICRAHGAIARAGR